MECALRSAFNIGASGILYVMKKRILTGDTPTGNLHLGHYVGTLENRVKLQDEYETFIILADTHSLTTLSDSPKVIREYARADLLDNLVVGLDPQKVTFFLESDVAEIYELAAIFSMYVSHARALRNPTIKEELKMKDLGEHYSLGFVNYPIYQAADILCVKANLVPVGEDQIPHLEQTREIARKINSLAGKEVFPIPEALVGKVARLPGTDGNSKMGKSLGNAIFLSDDAETVEKKVMGMYTDPTRVHPTDPGHVEGNPVFVYLNAFQPEADGPRAHAKIEELKDRYQKGTVGDVEVKTYLAEVLNKFLDPIRARRTELAKSVNLDRILEDGRRKVGPIAGDTLARVKETLGLG